MIHSKAISPQGELLSDELVIETLHKGLDGRFNGRRVLVLIPDHTRSMPLPFLFRALVDILRDVKQLDFIVALGTHPPLSDESLHRLIGISPEERASTFEHIGLLNHDWKNPNTLVSLG